MTDFLGDILNGCVNCIPVFIIVIKHEIGTNVGVRGKIILSPFRFLHLSTAELGRTVVDDSRTVFSSASSAAVSTPLSFCFGNQLWGDSSTIRHIPDLKIDSLLVIIPLTFVVLFRGTTFWTNSLSQSTPIG